jgi:hypothetical protein
MTPTEFHDRLMRYCALTGASVTSYGRTVRHNLVVEGVASSAHLFWLAADVVYDDATAPALAERWAERLGLKLIREEDHHHLQPLDWVPG